MTAPETGREIPADELVERLRKRAENEREIQRNNEAVADALEGQLKAFRRRDGTHNNFAVRLGLDHRSCAKKDAALAADWDAAADLIEAQAARLASLEALLHDIASDCRSPTAHAGNALRQIGDKIERAMEGVSAGVASLEAERARTVEECATFVELMLREEEPENQAAFDAAERIADAYNDGLPHATAAQRIEAMGRALVIEIRALASEKGQADV